MTTPSRLAFLPLLAVPARLWWSCGGSIATSADSGAETSSGSGSSSGADSGSGSGSGSSSGSSSSSGADSGMDHGDGGCPGGQTTCSGACVDEETDPNNCGACGTPCSGATPVCFNGSCAANRSCAPGGAGMTDCGASSESCCTSPEVTGGTFYRTYDQFDDFADGGLVLPDGGPTGEADPATVSGLRSTSTWSGSVASVSS